MRAFLCSSALVLSNSFNIDTKDYHVVHVMESRTEESTLSTVRSIAASLYHSLMLMIPHRACYIPALGFGQHPSQVWQWRLRIDNFVHTHFIPDSGEAARDIELHISYRISVIALVENAALNRAHAFHLHLHLCRDSDIDLRRTRYRKLQWQTRPRHRRQHLFDDSGVVRDVPEGRPTARRSRRGSRAR